MGRGDTIPLRECHSLRMEGAGWGKGHCALFLFFSLLCFCLVHLFGFVFFLFVCLFVSLCLSRGVLSCCLSFFFSVLSSFSSFTPSPPLTSSVLHSHPSTYLPSPPALSSLSLLLLYIIPISSFHLAMLLIPPLYVPPSLPSPHILLLSACFLSSPRSFLLPVPSFSPAPLPFFSFPAFMMPPYSLPPRSSSPPFFPFTPPRRPL